MKLALPFHVDPPSAALPDKDELAIQSAFRSRARILFPAVRIVATPNAGKRSRWEAMRAKAEGMVAGYPDCTCIWPGGIGWIEMKAKAGSLSEAQIEVLTFLHHCGHNVAVCRHPDTALAMLREWGAPCMAPLSIGAAA